MGRAERSPPRLAMAWWASRGSTHPAASLLCLGDLRRALAALADFAERFPGEVARQAAGNDADDVDDDADAAEREADDDVEQKEQG